MFLYLYNMQKGFDYLALVHLLRSYKQEEDWFEFKLNKVIPEMLGKYVSALSNSAAVSQNPYGYLVWGIDDSTHEVKGTSFYPETEKKGNMDLLNWLILNITPRINIDFIELETETGKHIVVMEVPAAISEPVRFMKDEYLRIGSHVQPLSKYPDYERILWKRFEHVPAEKHIVQGGVELDDLNKLLILEQYFVLQGLPTPSSTKRQAEKFLDEGFVVHQDDGAYGITALGALLFARDLRQFPSLASKALRIIRYQGAGRINAVNDITVSEGYAISFEKTCSLVYEFLKRPETIDGGLRKENFLFPPASVREVLGNILIHQDLSVMGAGPLVEVFDNRLEGSNPGALLVPADRVIDAPPRARNEALAAFLRRLHVCEERGSGFDRMEEGLESVMQPSPLVETALDFTRIKLFRYASFKDWTKADKIRTCYFTVCLKYVETVPVSNSMLRSRFGIDQANSAIVSRVVNDTIEAGLIRIQDASVGAKARRYEPYWA